MRIVISQWLRILTTRKLFCFVHCQMLNVAVDFVASSGPESEDRRG